MDKKIGKFDQLYREIPEETQPSYSAAVSLYPSDELSSAGIGINLPHHEVHEGNTFQSWVYTGTVANNNTLDLVIVTTGTSKVAHLTWVANAGGDALTLFYEGVSGTFNSSAPNFNLRRDSIIASPISVFHYPTITWTGLLLNTSLIPGGSGGATPGGTARAETEWLIAPNTKYLLRAQNIAGTSQPVNITIQWYQLE